MSRFLKVVPVSEAVAAVKKIAPPPVREEIPLEGAGGRVLVCPVPADTDIPGFDRSVVDGYAVRAAETAGAGEAVPAMLHSAGRIAMGISVSSNTIAPGSCMYVPTGGVLPEGADAVV